MSRKPEQKSFPVMRVAVIGCAAAVALLAALFAYNRLERFLIRDSRFALNEDSPTLEVAGAAHASHRQIEAVFADDLGRSVYLMPLSDRRATLRTVDWVKDASVARLWPNRVIVTIAERKPVAFVTLGSSKFALIDEDGIILPPATDRFPVPVLAGVRATDAIAERRDRVHRMLRLTRELGGNAAKLSEIDVTDRDNLKVTQSYDGQMLTMLLGDHNFGLRYENFLRNYGEIKRRLPGATTLDLRLEDRITVVE
jgi:cell division septal protein FtsQ